MRNSFRIVLFTLGMFPLMSTLAFGLPGLVNYKGLLTDPSGGPVAGPVDVTFTLWDAETGGNQLGAGFSDTDSVTPNADGIYDTLIGDDGGPMIPGAVFKNDSVWMNVNVDGEDLVPRTRLTPIGATLHAGDADTVDGLEGADLEESAEIAANAVAIAAEENRAQAAELTNATDIAAIDTSGIITNASNIAALDAIAFKVTASAYIVVETTGNAVTNGTNLITAYATAKALTPHSQALGVDNSAVVLVPPGKYDLGTGQLEMDAEFVDVAGLSSLRENQHIYGTSNGYGTGVLRQTADDVKIENLFIELGPTGVGINGDDQDPAAYFPDTAMTNTVVRNCIFKGDEISGRSMRWTIDYAGQYEDCTGGYYSFGRSGDASGTFTNCKGGNWSFGYGGAASGTFTNCTGGDLSFGVVGTASGTFINCTGGNDSFGRSGYATGIFTNCTGGVRSFGWVGNASGGKFYFCSGGTNSFLGAGGPTVIHCIRDGVPYP
jgi:hypothetical protein